MPSEPRQLTRAQRAAVYAVLGVAVEVGFTALDGARDARRRDASLTGHSYFWMFPIYGAIAYGYEPLHNRLRGQSRWRRAAAYSAGFLTAEYLSGMALKKAIGVIPWDYSEHSRFSVNGAIRLDYAPLWAVAGLALERIHDGLRKVRLAEK